MMAAHHHLRIVGKNMKGGDSRGSYFPADNLSWSVLQSPGSMLRWAYHTWVNVPQSR